MSRRIRVPRRLPALLALLAVLCATGLTACAPAASRGRVTLLASWTDAEGRVFQQVLDRFERQTGIEVDYQGTRALNQVLFSAVQNGSPPDVAVLASAGEFAQYISRSELFPLDDVIGPPGSNYTPQWRSLQELGTGHTYAVPVKAELKSMIWYNSARLRRTHPREADQLPAVRTWDQLVQLSHTLRRSGATPWCLGLADPPNSGWSGTDWVEDILLHQAGPIFYQEWAAGNQPWTTEQVRRAWTTWGEIAAVPGMIHGGIDAALLTDFADAGRPMFTDPPGCYLHRQASFMNGFYQRYTDRAGASLNLVPGQDFDYVPFPTDPATGSADQVWEVSADLAGMFRDTPAARALIAYLATDEAQRIWPEASAGTVFSVNTTVAEGERHELSRRVATTLTNAEDYVMCLDASDVMPAAMSSAFYQAVLAYLRDPGRLDRLLADLDQVRNGARTSDWLTVACGWPSR